MSNEGRIPLIPAIVDNRRLRYFIIFILYFAQGLPVGIFFFALPAWLSAQGASAAELGGYTFATSLPWSLKFINGFLMDRYTFLPMGRRRPWLIIAQSAIVLGLCAGAIINPSHQELFLLSALSFAVMTATTFQDVAIDGMAVDLVPDDERARVNGFMFGGQAIGISAGTAYTGFAIAAFGFAGAMLSVGIFVALILILVLTTRERAGEKLVPWSEGRASEQSKSIQVNSWTDIFAGVWREMIRSTSLKLIVAVVMSGTCYGLYIGAMPLIATNVAGWTAPEFSGITGIGSLVAGILGIAVFGIFADRLGPRNASIVLFGGILLGAVIVLLSKSMWPTDGFVIATAILFLSLNNGITIANCALAMRICDRKIGATQFTLYMAIGNFGISIGGAMLGFLDAMGGYYAIIIAMGAAASLGALVLMSVKNPLAGVIAASATTQS